MEPWSKSTDGTRSAQLFSFVGALALVAAMIATLPGGAVARGAKASPAPTPFGKKVPIGVDIPVQLVTQINSATFQVGDSFEFKTTKDVNLDGFQVPVGTGGHGRVASVARATDKQNGSVAIQADSLDLSDGTPIWVNIDPKTPVQGHLADKRTRFLVVAISTDFTGNMVLEPGTQFKVLTTTLRAGPAPLITASPDASTSPSSPAVSPAAMQKATPAAMQSAAPVPTSSTTP